MIRDAQAELRDPKYAHIERERRWLVDAARCCPAASSAHVRIEDRYIIQSRMRLRRMTDSVTGRQSLKLTKKYAVDDPLAGPIVTAYLAQAEYELLATLPAATIAKRRHKIASHGLTYSVDVFCGAHDGLVLAEIEWPDDQGLRALPDPAFAVREVSHEVEYQGGYLAAQTAKG